MSDHAPIKLNLFFQPHQGPKPFWFLEAWTCDLCCASVIDVTLNNFNYRLWMTPLRDATIERDQCYRIGIAWFLGIVKRKYKTLKII